MSVLFRASITNRLINLISEPERAVLLQHSERVELEFGSVLCEAKQRYSHLYFPLNSFISLFDQVAEHKPLEVSLIGNEGMLGVTLLLGVNTAPMQAIVQGKGMAWRISFEKMRQLMKQCPQLHYILQQYLYVSILQLSRNSACIHFHKLEHRLARWLLMSGDRANSNYFHLTHQFLADMLGVRRSGVTVAAGIMQQKKLISYSRGMVSILDRCALKAVACECYQADLDNYYHAFGQLTVDNIMMAPKY